ncbi:hypothetical protein [Roseobacter sp. HKCCA0434]|uniref:hypothetical protein n=1 Tax=Roseobacter sp. HKCCA0434 TaxID=3079297 RepID=UPI0029059DA1|nr:hypothetical protein [Roseobacter sp. HKCCA0434]
MLLAAVSRLGATLEIKRRRAVGAILGGFFLLLALLFGFSAVWIWAAARYGAVGTNLVFALIFAIIGAAILVLGRPRRPAPVLVPPVAPVAAPAGGLVPSLLAAYVAGTQIGRAVRR